MHYAILFLYRFLPLEIILIGITILLGTGLFSKKLTRRFPFLQSRMRILYGYLAIVSSIVSLIAFWYIYSPFQEVWQPYFATQISPFTAGAFIAVSIGTVILSFISMVEIDLSSTNSYLLFISILLLESCSWFILSSDSWINILFGFILMFTGGNLFIRGLYEKGKLEHQKVFTNFLMMSSIALSLLFIGIACFSISGNEFTLSFQSTTLLIWEYIGITFVIISLLIQMGVPPFHNWFFKLENTRYNSLSYLLLIIQRSISFMFLVKYSLTISGSNLKEVLLWLFTLLGIIYLLWGILGSITVKRLQTTLHYISLFYIGLLLLLLADVFSEFISQEYLTSSITSVSFGIFTYIVLFSLSISLFSSISKGFKTDTVDILGSLGRNSISQYLVNLLNILLVFGAPVFLFVLSKKYRFSSDFTIRMYIVSISILVTLVLSLVYFLKLIRALHNSRKRHEIQLLRIEPATKISTILLCIITVSLMIVIVQLIRFCELITFSLLS